MIAQPPHCLNDPPPIPLWELRLEALSADLQAAGTVATAPTIIRHLTRNLVSRSLPADCGEGIAYGAL